MEFRRITVKSHRVVPAPPPPEEVPYEVPEEEEPGLAPPTLPPPVIAPPAPVPPEYPTPLPGVSIGVSETTTTLPWYAAWLKPVIDYIGILTEGVVNYFAPILKPLDTIGKFFTDPIGSVIQKINNLFSASRTQSIFLATDLVKDLRGGSTEEMSSFESENKGLTDQFTEQVEPDVNPNVLPNASASPEEARDYLNKLANIVHGMNLSVFGVHAGIEAGSLGQFEFIKDYPNIVLNKFGYDAIVRANAMLPVEKSVLKKAEYYFNQLFTPEIPGYSDLINMVVKEKITLDQFKTYMKFKGYNTEFAQLIWDAHFIAPSLGQILTSFRRGRFGDPSTDAAKDRVRDLQILVDLDPVYNEIWGDQWFYDPTPRQGRWMFEEGTIDYARLKNLVERSGMLPGDVDAFTDMLAKFQARPFKSAWIRALGDAYEAGVYDEGAVRSMLEAEKVSGDIAYWIAKEADVRRSIAEAKVKPIRATLLTMGIAKDAFMFGIVDEVWLRQYFTERGYDDADISIAIDVWKYKKGAS